jgi:hypothetical protein
LALAAPAVALHLGRMPPAAVLQLVMQGGGLVLLACVLYGLYTLARPVAASLPVMRAEARASRELLAQHLPAIQSEIGQVRERIAGLQAEQRAGFAAAEQRITLAEERLGAAVDRAAADVMGVVRERASHVAAEVAGELGRGPTTARSPDTCNGRSASVPRCAA